MLCNYSTICKNPSQNTSTLPKNLLFFVVSLSPLNNESMNHENSFYISLLFLFAVSLSLSSGTRWPHLKEMCSLKLTF